MKISVTENIRFGLVYYSVNVDGRPLHTFMSKEHAVTCFTRLKTKLGVSNA